MKRILFEDVNLIFSNRQKKKLSILPHPINSINYVESVFSITNFIQRMKNKFYRIKEFL